MYLVVIFILKFEKFDVNGCVFVWSILCVKLNLNILVRYMLNCFCLYKGNRFLVNFLDNGFLLLVVVKINGISLFFKFLKNILYFFVVMFFLYKLSKIL